MLVDVDQPGREIESRDVDGLFAGAGRDGWFDGGNFAVANGYIPLGIHIVFRIENMAVAKNQIILLSVRAESKGKESSSQDANH
jgi:hypothetical protein